VAGRKSGLGAFPEEKTMEAQRKLEILQAMVAMEIYKKGISLDAQVRRTGANEVAQLNKTIGTSRPIELEEFLEIVIEIQKALMISRAQILDELLADLRAKRQ
jgi:hypothetical protein